MWPMQPGFRKMLQLDILCFHTIYHRDSSWRSEDIRSRNTMNYIGKTFSHHYDVTSFPIDTNLILLLSLPIMYSKFEGNRMIYAEITNMSLLVHFYIAQILPEPEVVRLHVYNIKLDLIFFFPKHYFIPIGSLVAKIQLDKQFRVLCVYFWNWKCNRNNSKHLVQISAL